jgi:hypothetical protein
LIAPATVAYLRDGRRDYAVYKLYRGRVCGVFYTAAVFVVFLAAGCLGFVAHYGLGLSRQETRTGALLIATLLATLIAMEFFVTKLRKSK